MSLQLRINPLKLMYMKRILTILAAVAMVMTAASCDPEQTPSLSFGKAQYVLLADAPLTVDVVTDVAPSADLEIALSFTGDAVLNDEYTVSAQSVVIPAGQVKGSITVTPSNNFETGKSIVISMTLPTGYEFGKNSSATVAVDAKELLQYSFAVAQANVADRYVVRLELSGLESGADWVASADMEIPFTITPAATEAIVLADDALVVKKGENVATLEVNAGEIVGDPVEFVIAVDEEKAGERFNKGTNTSITLNVMGAMKLSKLVGKWEFAETLDLEELEMWFMDMEDDPEFLPTHNEGFNFTISEKDGVYTLTPSAEGDWAKYFKVCQIDYCAPIEDNMCSYGTITGPYTTLENQMFVAESEGVDDLAYTYFSLSSVYRNFDGDAEAVGTGAIAITNDADGNLIILIKDYDQPPFGEMWWDPGYDPDMFSFASRFTKVTE